MFSKTHLSLVAIAVLLILSVEEGVVLFPFRTLAMVSGLVSIWAVSRLIGKQ